MGGHDTRLRSEQESQQNQRSTNTTPAPVLGLRTASYCTENEGTPKQAKRPSMALVQKANEGRFGLSRQEVEQVQMHSVGRHGRRESPREEGPWMRECSRRTKGNGTADVGR